MDANEESMLAIAADDIDALEALYAAFRLPVFATALAIVRDRTLAEEVSHDTFVRVYERADRYQPGSNPRAWIISIARNLAYDQLRGNQREAPFGRVESVTEGDQVGRGDQRPHEITTIDSLVLKQVLNELDPVDREIVMLHVVVGLRHREIASQLQMPPSTVRWRYRRSLKYLAQFLEGDSR